MIDRAPLDIRNWLIIFHAQSSPITNRVVDEVVDHFFRCSDVLGFLSVLVSHFSFLYLTSPVPYLSLIIWGFEALY